MKTETKSNLKITPGEWRQEDGRVYGECPHSGEEIVIAETAADNSALTEYDEANAQLIAEAGTVANECGLMPRELLRQRDDLSEALETLANRIGSLMRDYELPEDVNGIICGELDAANDALSKTKGQK